MSLTVYADVFTDADFTGTSQTLRFKPTKNIAMRAIRTWFVFFNDPTFTDITAKLYADRNESVAGLIASSSTTHTKASLFTDNSAYLETYFAFGDIALRKDTYYHIVINGTGYTFNDDSYIAWAKAWPDPVYGTPSIPSVEQIHVSQYFLSVVGDDL